MEMSVAQVLLLPGEGSNCHKLRTLNVRVEGIQAALLGLRSRAQVLLGAPAPQVFRALPIPVLPASLFLPQHSNLVFYPKAQGQCEAEAQRGTLVPAFSSYLARALACRYRTPSKCSLGILVFQTAGHKCYQPQLQPTDPCGEPQS